MIADEPAAPALVILGLLAPQHFLARRGVRLFSGSASRRRLAVSVVLAVALPGSHVADGVGKRLRFRIHANREHAVVSSRVRDHVPADSILLANRATGSLRNYTDLACIGAEFTRARPVSDELVARIAGSGRPVVVVVHDNAATVPMGSGPATAWWGFAGTWEKRASLWDGGVGVWQWMPPPGWSRDAEPR